MEFERLEWDEKAAKSKVVETIFLPADDVILAIGQENAFPWIERDLGIEFDKWEMPVVDEKTMQCSAPAFSSAAMRLGDQEHHLGRGPRPRSGDLHTCPLSGRSGYRAAAGWHESDQPENGISEWSYHNDYNPATRQKMKHVDLVHRFEQLNVEVEIGFNAEQTAREVQRCLNCDVETVFTPAKCIECDACVDICPLLCLTITRDGDESEVRQRLSAPAVNPDQALYASAPFHKRVG